MLVICLPPLSIHNWFILSIYSLTFVSLSKEHFYNVLFSSNIHLCLRVDISITPDPKVLPETSGLGGLNTITLPVDSSDISSFVSVFVLFIFVKDLWILFRYTKSACYFYPDTITRRVALLESDPVPDSQPDVCLHHAKTNTYISISINLSFYIYESIYLSIYLSISISISIYRSVYLSIYLSLHIYIYLYIYTQHGIINYFAEKQKSK